MGAALHPWFLNFPSSLIVFFFGFSASPLDLQVPKVLRSACYAQTEYARNWSARTPEGFLFCVKVPQVVTHDKALVDCDSEFEEFVKTMDMLGPKLGPMVFQFPSFDRWKFPKQDRAESRILAF